MEEPGIPFQITSIDNKGPYPLTPRVNKYLLMFIDHFLKYVEAYPIKVQTVEICARVYATQIVTRHGTGSTLITDQGPAFMSAFFNETCKAIGTRKIRTTSYHLASNWIVVRLHRSLHTVLSHFTTRHTKIGITLFRSISWPLGPHPTWPPGNVTSSFYMGVKCRFPVTIIWRPNSPAATLTCSGEFKTWKLP